MQTLTKFFLDLSKVTKDPETENILYTEIQSTS